MSKRKQKVYDQKKGKYVEKRDFGVFSEAGDKYGKKYVIMVFGIFLLALVGLISIINIVGGFIIGLI